MTIAVICIGFLLRGQKLPSTPVPLVAEPRPPWGPWGPLRSPGGIGELQLEGVNVDAGVDDVVDAEVDALEGELEGELGALLKNFVNPAMFSSLALKAI